MAEASTGVFSTIIELTDGDEFKFLPKNTALDNYFGEDPDNPGTLIEDGGNTITSTAGLKVIAVNVNTMNFTVTDVTGEIPTKLYLVGAFSYWDLNEDFKFEKTKDGVFVTTQALTAENEFQFFTATDDNWGENVTYPGVLYQRLGNNVKVTVDGNYQITVDFNNGTIDVILLLN